MIFWRRFWRLDPPTRHSSKRPRSERESAWESGQAAAAASTLFWVLRCCRVAFEAHVQKCIPQRHYRISPLDLPISPTRSARAIHRASRCTPSSTRNHHPLLTPTPTPNQARSARPPPWLPNLLQHRRPLSVNAMQSDSRCSPRRRRRRTTRTTAPSPSSQPQLHMQPDRLGVLLTSPFSYASTLPSVCFYFFPSPHS
jgi:hypothetical protein